MIFLFTIGMCRFLIRVCVPLKIDSHAYRFFCLFAFKYAIFNNANVRSTCKNLENRTLIEILWNEQKDRERKKRSRRIKYQFVHSHLLSDGYNTNTVVTKKKKSQSMLDWNMITIYLFFFCFFYLLSSCCNGYDHNYYVLELKFSLRSLYF